MIVDADAPKLRHVLSRRHYDDFFFIRKQNVASIRIHRYPDRKVRIPLYRRIDRMPQYFDINRFLHTDMRAYCMGKHFFILIKPVSVNAVFHSFSFRDREFLRFYVLHTA